MSVSADASAYSTIPALEAFLDDKLPGEAGRRRARYLLNRFDGRRPLDRDVFASLRGILGDRVFPFAVQDDPAVPMAAARGRFVIEESPESQVTADVASLGDWIDARSTDRVGNEAPRHAVKAH